MLRRHPHPRTQPSVHRPPTQRPRAPPTAPSGPGAPVVPAVPTEPQGWAEGGAEKARARLEQVARRGLGTRGLIQSARPVRPAPNSGSPAGPPPTPPQRGAHGFCFGGDENQDPRGGGAAAAGGSPAQG